MGSPPCCQDFFTEFFSSILTIGDSFAKKLNLLARPYLQQVRWQYLADFWLCPFFRRFFAHVTCTWIFLTVKHRQHVINLVRNSMCIGSIASFLMLTNLANSGENREKVWARALACLIWLSINALHGLFCCSQVRTAQLLTGWAIQYALRSFHHKLKSAFILPCSTANPGKRAIRVGPFCT
jgi:hypothetical protein